MTSQTWTTILDKCTPRELRQLAQLVDALRRIGRFCPAVARLVKTCPLPSILGHLMPWAILGLLLGRLLP